MTQKIEIPNGVLGLNKAVFNFKVKVEFEVDWPGVYEYGGEKYCFTGKEGVRISDNMPSAEYQSVEASGERIWLRLDGSVEPE